MKLVGNYQLPQCSQVFHDCVPTYQSNHIEQKRKDRTSITTKSASHFTSSIKSPSSKDFRTSDAYSLLEPPLTPIIPLS